MMHIDIGSTSKKETEAMSIRIGDPVVPMSPFSIIKNGKLGIGKMFDDQNRGLHCYGSCAQAS